LTKNLIEKYMWLLKLNNKYYTKYILIAQYRLHIGTVPNILIINKNLNMLYNTVHVKDKQFIMCSNNNL